MLPNNDNKPVDKPGILIHPHNRTLKFLAAFAVAAFFCLCAQSRAQVKEYIYLDGKLLAVEADGQANFCTFIVSPSSDNFPSGGGTDSVSITASKSTCARTATSNDPSWITVTSGGSGTGNGTVNYSVAGNSGPARIGTISVAEHTFIVSQSACTYSISPTSNSMPGAGGNGSVSVTCSSGSCGWTATSNDGWITITSGGSGTGNGTVNYSVASNSGSERSGTATIAGKTFTVNQAAMTAVCGDGICNGTETCQTCVNDCCPWCPSCMAQCMSFPPFDEQYCRDQCNCN